MAMIKCPECDSPVSDKAYKCPKCGYPIQENTVTNSENYNKVQTTNAVNIIEETSYVQQNKKVEIPHKAKVRRKTKKKLVMLGSVLAVLIVFIAVYFVFLEDFLARNIRVDDITIESWKCIESDENSNTYEAIVTSKQKKPFIAVIGFYNSEVIRTDLVYMEDGKGIFEDTMPTSADPSQTRKPVGYIGGRVLKDSDISYKYTDSNYYDNSSSNKTSCDVLFDIKLKSGETGLLIFEIENKESGEVFKNRVVTVIDGKAEYEYSAKSPYGAREVQISINPKMFCESDEVDEDDYEIEKAYAVTKQDIEGGVALGAYYRAEKALKFDKYKMGYVIYTSKCIEGRDVDKDKKVKNVFLNNHICNLTEVDLYYGDDSDKEPVYEFEVYGCLECKPLEKEN